MKPKYFFDDGKPVHVIQIKLDVTADVLEIASDCIASVGKIQNVKNIMQSVRDNGQLSGSDFFELYWSNNYFYGSEKENKAKAEAKTMCKKLFPYFYINYKIEKP